MLSARAVQRAKQRLVDAHREEYVALLNHERRRLGLEHIRNRRWRDVAPTTAGAADVAINSTVSPDCT
ncbi:MAG: hypothetical protein M3133_03155 [Actinomycetota bacterium]|nr:hypothetical protein [Actinomycetota bacterium]